MQNDAPRVPALILGGRWVFTLSIIRSLGRKHIPLFATGTDGSFVAYSRWHRGAPAEWGIPSPTRLSEFLTELPIDRMVVIPCSDEWALALAEVDPTVAARLPQGVLRQLQGRMFWWRAGGERKAAETFGENVVATETRV